MLPLPDESCRVCGGNLKSFVKCTECLRTIQFQCLNCKHFTSTQYHNHNIQNRVETFPDSNILVAL